MILSQIPWIESLTMKKRVFIVGYYAYHHIPTLEFKSHKQCHWQCQTWNMKIYETVMQLCTKMVSQTDYTQTTDFC